MRRSSANAEACETTSRTTVLLLRGLAKLQISALLIIGMLVLVACSVTQTPSVPSGDPVLEDGRAIYIRNCASCHGSAGDGGQGPKLSEGKMMVEFEEISEQIDLVADGQGGMPAFSGRLTDEEIEAVVRFTREVL